MKRFDCMLHGSKVGEVQVFQNGLYYEICCRTKLKCDGFYRLYVSTSNGQIPLGICIPTDGKLGNDLKIPTNRITSEMKGFCIVPKEQNHSFVSLHENHQFFFLHKLPDAVLEIENGIYGIRFISAGPEKRDNDPTP